MAPNSEGVYPRPGIHGVRRLDYLEAGIRSGSERVSGSYRNSANGSFGKGRNPYDLGRAYGILFIISATGGAEAARIIAGHKWGI